jgi:chromosome segregation ATPase
MIRQAIAAWCCVLTVCVITHTPAAGDTRSERRIEDIQYAIRDKQKILDNLGAQREKLDPLVTREKTAYETSEKEVASLEAELAEARKAAGEANNALQEVTRQLQEQIANEPRVVEAQQAADAARQRHDQAREQAMGAIAESPEYRRIVEDTETRQAKLELMQDASAVVDPLEIQTLQFEISQLLVRKRQYVDGELEKLPQVVEAKEALDQASRNLAQVRAQYNQQIDNNPQRRAAEKTATEARLNIADLSTKLRVARSEQARSKTRYARAHAVMADLQKKIDREEMLMEGLHDELRLARQDR